MPIYAFDCQECGVPFEELVLNSRMLAELACPKCGSTQLKKKLATIALRITGGQNSTRGSAGANCAPGGL